MSHSRLRFVRSRQPFFIKSPNLFYMARIKTQEDKRIPVPEAEYLRLMENTLIVEALKIAGIEEMPIWKAMMRILDDKRIEIHVRPVYK